MIKMQRAILFALDKDWTLIAENIDLKRNQIVCLNVDGRRNWVTPVLRAKRNSC